MLRQILIFFISPFFIAQATDAAQLVINISDSRDAKKYVHLSELKILRDGKVLRILHPEFEHKQLLKKLDFGTYTLVYKTLFNKEEQLSLEITEQKKYSVNVYIDYLDYSKETYTPIIDQLQKKDSCIFFIESQGCFHFSKDTLVVRRNQDVYTMNWGRTFKTLSLTDIEKIRHFEMELSHMAGGGCTTTDTYLIYYHETPVLCISDGSCSWNGDDYLKKGLFGNK